MTRDETRQAFEEALERAEEAARQGDSSARKLFWEAHYIGRNQTSLHVKGHLALLRFAVRQRNFGESLSQSGLVVAAVLMTWMRPQMPPPRRSVR